MFIFRFCELRADYDQAQDKIREVEKENETLRRSIEEQEERHKSMYLKMYMKGQEAAKFEHADQVRGHIVHVV
jgi:cell division septum initiation protein DivIVA